MKLALSLPIVFLIALVLNDCGQDTKTDLPQDAAPPPPSGAVDAPVCIYGTLSDEGAECPVLLTESGGRISLAGSTAPYRAGALVCVCGRPAEMSICVAQETLVVDLIDRICPD